MYPQVFGKYVLERELARGGMARVMLATLRGAGGFEKRLVVKQIRDELASDEDFVGRFVEEAKTTVALAHPNIVTVYELGVELGTYYLAMEWVEGASLSELLRASSPRGLSPEEGAYVGVEVCRALDYAHRRMNVVHRDVTPRNVMVDEEGQIKVIDFGIAAPVATAPSGHGIFGSPGHMPPEQMEGLELTPAADVFAVAVLLMEVWSGRALFRRQTTADIEHALRAPHPKASDMDIRLLPLDEIVASSLSLDARARPQQADDLGRALRRFLAGIDLGDLARQLGDRVRAVREHPPPPVEPHLVLQRPPSRPSATQVGTKTFAAREEVRSLTPSLDRREGSTRRLPSAAPVLEAADGAASAIERPRRFILATGGTLAAVLASAAAFWAHGTASTRSVAGPIAVVRAAVSVRSPEVAQASSTPIASVGPAETARRVPTAIPAERAQILLLGDGTLARVDGAPAGSCPIRTSVAPGTHAIVFTFPATGESKGESLRVRAGEHVTLRADFTAAAPTVRVER